MFPEQSEQQVFQRMSEMFKTGRLNPRAVGVWLDALEQQEYVPAEESHEAYLCRMDQYPYPYAARERAIEDRVLVDSMRDAGDAVRQKYSDVYDRTPHVRAASKNRAHIDGNYYGDDSQPDHCAFCAVLKEQCIDQATHFGDRGESPPDSVCVDCGSGFGNIYSSAKDLALHRSVYRKPWDKCNKEDFERNRRRRMRLPLYDASELAEFKRQEEERDAQDKAVKKGKVGASKKAKKN